jgi:hypothetical protein
MFLIDTIAVNGETKVRKRRVCRKCHRVNVTMTGTRQTCEECRLKSPRSTDMQKCIASMRIEREAERRADEVFQYAMALRAAFDADRQRATG